MGVDVQVTYNGAAPVDSDTEYNSIAKALKGAVDFGKKIREQILNELVGRTAPATSDSSAYSQYPPGYARMLEAARELYNISVDANKPLPVAARGYVETAELSQPEEGWNYFAAMRPQDLSRLQRSFKELCESITETDAKKQLENSLRDVIAVLTGDEFRNDLEFQRYFDDRGKIPLATQTMLGAGLLGLVEDIISPMDASIKRVANYQREVCRTATLINLMQGNQRLAAPYDKGDLYWDDARKSFGYKNAEQFNWILVDDFLERTVFLPLSNLPQPGRSPGRTQLERSLPD